MRSERSNLRTVLLNKILGPFTVNINHLRVIDFLAKKKKNSFRPSLNFWKFQTLNVRSVCHGACCFVGSVPFEQTARDPRIRNLDSPSPSHPLTPSPAPYEMESYVRWLASRQIEVPHACVPFTLGERTNVLMRIVLV